MVASRFVGYLEFLASENNMDVLHYFAFLLFFLQLNNEHEKFIVYENIKLNSPRGGGHGPHGSPLGSAYGHDCCDN